MIVRARRHSETMSKLHELCTDSLFEVANQILDLEEENENLRDEIDTLSDLVQELENA